MTVRLVMPAARPATAGQLGQNSLSDLACKGLLLKLSTMPNLLTWGVVQAGGGLFLSPKRVSFRLAWHAKLKPKLSREPKSLRDFFLLLCEYCESCM